MGVDTNVLAQFFFYPLRSLIIVYGDAAHHGSRNTRRSKGVSLFVKAPSPRVTEEGGERGEAIAASSPALVL